MKRDLQKDRPPPLKIQKQEIPQKVRRDLWQIPPSQYRQPVIIHTYSPEVIQTDSSNFMKLVQKLTGPESPVAPPQPKRVRGLPQSETKLPATSQTDVTEFQQPSDEGNSITSSSPQEFVKTISEKRLLPTRQRNRPNMPWISPLGVQVRQTFHGSSDPGALPTNPLLSPSVFDCSPSLLPSPSAFDFPFLFSPTGLGSPIASGTPNPAAFAPNVLPSPARLSPGLLADLPVLSPAAYNWIERNWLSAEVMLSSRPSASASLPPRPPGHGIHSAASATGNSFQSDERSVLVQSNESS